MSEEEAKTSGLYHLLFGNKDIPITTDVEVLPQTQNFIYGVAAILVVGAILTAYIIKK